ncbi:phosphatase PAP2 family protein [Shimia sp. SDUM112013]|uniref:phosphatase PAP2 family protein n=1 Tax=Shimia sp. SDUM112013 TaxID=3136160 RepID=UPI0032EFB0A9
MTRYAQIHDRNTGLAGLDHPSLIRPWMIAMGISATLFTLFPGTDLWASALFYSDGFILQDRAHIEGVRHALLGLSLIPCVLALLELGISLVTSHPILMLRRHMAFILCLFALAPGLLVNGLLKRHWGRARPVRTEEFGGQAEFTPALEITNQCGGNCSFVSAETASVTAGAISVYLLTARLQHRGWRLSLRALACLVLFSVAVMRIALGRHFLSDVVFAGLFTLGCALLLARQGQVSPRKALARLRRRARMLGLPAPLLSKGPGARPVNLP